MVLLSTVLGGSGDLADLKATPPTIVDNCSRVVVRRELKHRCVLASFGSCHHA